ncbi:acyltransferase domain protein [Chondrocystis sp. NIES-4102]|nr:acyltransferase domain protein [Chondrocystis sp. NIES-4102]
MSHTDKSNAKFLPPRLNPLLTRLIQSIFGIVLDWVYKIKLVIDEEDISKLRAIAPYTVVYLPNHSNLDDGLVMFLLSARIGQLFYYVVAYEAFKGIIGKLMLRVGAYSIRRGIGDRQSIKQTLQILQQPQAKLVIFPEGGCSYQNDTVMPFRSGSIELAFKAMDKLAFGAATIPDFYLVPITLKYTYLAPTDIHLVNSLKRLETALSLPSQDDLYLRLRAIAAQVLTNLETEYNLTPLDLNDWNQRIQDLKKHLLNYCEEKLNITPSPQIPIRERVYKVQYLLNSLSLCSLSKDADHQHLYLTTVRLLNFDAIYDGYVAAKPTPERFFATLDRLEREVFKIDRPKFKGRKQVQVKVSSPINLKQYWQTDYQSFNSKDKTSRQLIINQLTQNIHQAVQEYLN